MDSAPLPRAYVGVNVSTEYMLSYGITDMMRRHAARVIDEALPRLQKSAANMANESWRRAGKRRGRRHAR